ncbi:CGNR zinc finger domain-containing protein [Streptomyces sp. NPDC093097]|uniref:CGNR zinc finger domain-containing protein n=1 Tax=Streptomyces sp. NPDC093097 TaxID=3366027 RepID=UPI0037F5F349
MQVNPYGEDPVRFVVDLTNAPPTSADELAERAAAAGMALDRPVTEDDLSEVLDFLVRWAEVVDAPTDARRAELLNALLADAAGHPRLTDHADGGWHIHYREDDRSLGGVLRAVAGVGTALHLTGLGMHRLGRCALAECDNAFADFSRAGRQRYCCPLCANRDAVRRHRARREKSRHAGEER